MRIARPSGLLCDSQGKERICFREPWSVCVCVCVCVGFKVGYVGLKLDVIKGSLKQRNCYAYFVFDTHTLHMYPAYYTCYGSQDRR